MIGLGLVPGLSSPLPHGNVGDCAQPGAAGDALFHGADGIVAPIIEDRKPDLCGAIQPLFEFFFYLRLAQARQYSENSKVSRTSTCQLLLGCI